MNNEIRAVVAAHPERSAPELVDEVAAIMTRYGVPEPSSEGLVQWINQAIAETRAR